MFSETKDESERVPRRWRHESTTRPARSWSEERLGAPTLSDARAELAEIRRELIARLVTVPSRKSYSSTAAPSAYRDAVPTGSPTRWDQAERDANARSADFGFDISKSGPTFARWHEAVLALALIVSGTIVSLPPMKLALWTAGCLAIAHLMIRVMRGK